MQTMTFTEQGSPVPYMQGMADVMQPCLRGKKGDLEDQLLHLIVMSGVVSVSHCNNHPLGIHAHKKAGGTFNVGQDDWIIGK